jgi:hypothetical protein
MPWEKKEEKKDTRHVVGKKMEKREKKNNK